MEKENDKLKKEIEILKEQIKLLRELSFLRNDAMRLCDMYGAPTTFRQLQPVVYIPQYINVPQYIPCPVYIPRPFGVFNCCA